LSGTLPTYRSTRTQQGHEGVKLTSDPGRGLITGHWKNIGHREHQQVGFLLFDKAY